MPEPTSNLIAAIAGKAKSSTPAVDQIMSFSGDRTGIGKTSFLAEFSKASDAQFRSSTGAAKSFPARRDSLPGNLAEPSRDRFDKQQPIRKHSDRHDSTWNASVAPRNSERSEKVDHSAAADSVSHADKTRNSSNGQQAARADKGPDATVAPLSHKESGHRGKTASTETQGNKTAEAVSVDVDALKASTVQADSSDTDISQLFAELPGTGHANAVAADTIVTDENSDTVPISAQTGVDEATVSLSNDTSAFVESATPSVLVDNAVPSAQNTLTAEATHADVSKANDEVRVSAIASQLQSLETIRNTAQAQSTTVSTSDTADLVLQSGLQSRYLLSAGLPVKVGPGEKSANLAQNVLTQDPAEGDAAATVAEAGVKNLPVTSIAGLQVARLNQMAGKVADANASSPEATSTAVTDALTHGEATPAMQKQLASVVQSLAATADAQQFPTTVKDSVVNNTLAAVSGGIVTAPVVQRTDSGTGQVVSAPATVPLLTPSAESGLVSNVRWMLGEGVKQAVVNVTPSGMGPISVQIGIEKEQMNVSIVATQGSTREALEALLPRLREQLAAQGHDSVRIDVSDGRSEQSRAGGGQQSDQFQPQTQMDDLAQQKNSAGNTGELASDDQQNENSETDERTVSGDTPMSFASHDEYVRHGRGVYDAYV